MSIIEHQTWATTISRMMNGGAVGAVAPTDPNLLRFIKSSVVNEINALIATSSATKTDIFVWTSTLLFFEYHLVSINKFPGRFPDHLYEKSKNWVIRAAACIPFYLYPSLSYAGWADRNEALELMVYRMYLWQLLEESSPIKRYCQEDWDECVLKLTEVYLPYEVHPHQYDDERTDHFFVAFFKTTVQMNAVEDISLEKRIEKSINDLIQLNGLDPDAIGLPPINSEGSRNSDVHGVHRKTLWFPNAYRRGIRWTARDYENLQIFSRNARTHMGAGWVIMMMSKILFLCETAGWERSYKSSLAAFVTELQGIDGYKLIPTVTSGISLSTTPFAYPIRNAFWTNFQIAVSSWSLPGPPGSNLHERDKGLLELLSSGLMKKLCDDDRSTPAAVLVDALTKIDNHLYESLWLPIAMGDTTRLQPNPYLI